jgi:hypothetical protein
MLDRLVVLATFGNEVEAALARNLLQAGGIPAQMEGEGTANIFGSIGNPFGVRLLVFERDLPQAEQVLDEHEAKFQAPAGPPETGLSSQRTCPACGKPFASGLAACPYCGPELDSAGLHDPDDEAITTPDEMARSDAEAQVRRALRAAIIGLLILPPIVNLYSLWLLVRVFSFDGELSPRGLRRYYLALALNLAAIPVSCFMFNSVFHISGQLLRGLL